ncbi:hypothetical protein Tco_0505114 [Tanacetum coccineum]
MAERTMEELLRAPTEGYGEAIVLPEINADHFEIKTNLLQLVQAKPIYNCHEIGIDFMSENLNNQGTSILPPPHDGCDGRDLLDSSNRTK